MTPDVRIRRIYEEPAPGDGYRVLVDGLWPRGISREAARLDEWVRDLAPSTELRRWYGHEASRFAAFRTRYRQELRDHETELEALRIRARAGAVTLVYAARDPLRNNAVVLREELLRESVRQR